MHGAVDEVQAWIRSSYASVNHFTRQAVVSSLGSIVDSVVHHLCPLPDDPGRIRWYRPESVSRCPTITENGRSPEAARAAYIERVRSAGSAEAIGRALAEIPPEFREDSVGPGGQAALDGEVLAERRGRAEGLQGGPIRSRPGVK
jgi:hypothetical protein